MHPTRRLKRARTDGPTNNSNLPSTSSRTQPYQPIQPCSSGPHPSLTTATQPPQPPPVDAQLVDQRQGPISTTAANTQQASSTINLPQPIQPKTNEPPPPLPPATPHQPPPVDIHSADQSNCPFCQTTIRNGMPAKTHFNELHKPELLALSSNDIIIQKFGVMVIPKDSDNTPHFVILNPVNRSKSDKEYHRVTDNESTSRDNASETKETLTIASNLSSLLELDPHKADNIMSRYNSSTLKQTTTAASTVVRHAYAKILHLILFDIEGKHGPQLLDKNQINQIGAIALQLFSVLCLRRRPHNPGKQSKKQRHDDPTDFIGLSHMHLIDLFLNGSILSLIDDATTSLDKSANAFKDIAALPSHSPPSEDEQKIINRNNVKKSTTHIQNGRIGKAIDCLSQKHPVPPSDEVRQLIQDKNPKCEDDNWADEFKTSETTTPLLTIKQLKEALVGTTSSDCCGSLGISLFILKGIFPITDLFQEIPSYIQEAIVTVINRFFGCGNLKPLHPLASKILRFGRAIALPKGIDDIRPLGISCSILKIGEKALIIQHVKPFLENNTLFNGLQLGIGVKGGVELLIKRTMESLHDASNQHGANTPVLMKVDAENAFGRFHINATLRAVKKQLPVLLKPLLAPREGATNLFLGSPRVDEHFEIYNYQGWIQGGTFGTFAYCAAVQQLIETADAAFQPQPMSQFNIDEHLIEHAYYCDDGNVVADLTVCIKYLDLITRKGVGYGYHTKPNKTTILSVDKYITKETIQNIVTELGITTISPADINEMTICNPDSGTILGGIPVGNPDWVQNELSNRLYNTADKFENVLLHPSAQYRALLTGNLFPCYNNHLARMAPAHLLTGAILLEKQSLLHLYEETIGQGIPDDDFVSLQQSSTTPSSTSTSPSSPSVVFDQLTLPYWMGGQNLRSMADSCDPAYVACLSLIASNDKNTLRGYYSYLSRIPSTVGNKEFSNFSPGSEIPYFYTALSNILSKTHGTETGTAVALSLINDLSLNINIAEFSLLSANEISSLLQKNNTLVIAQAVNKVASTMQSKPQKLLTKCMHEAKLKKLLNTKHPYETDIQTQCRLYALQMKGSGASSTVRIRENQFNYKSNVEFITHQLYRLGLPLNINNYIPKICPTCKKKGDIRGLHQTNCKKRPMKTQPHNATIRAFASILPAASDTQTEVRGTGSIENNRRRPMDMTCNVPGSPKMFGLDLSIISSHVICHENYFKDNKGWNHMKSLERLKIDNLKGCVNFCAYDYYPVICTTYGGIGPKARELCVELADAHGSESLSLRNWYLKLFLDTLSFTIQQQHARYTSRFVDEAFNKTVESDHGVIVPNKYYPRASIPITPSPVRPVAAW